MRLPLLQRNPLTAVGTLDRCWLFVYRTPVAEARGYLPKALEPVTRGGHAFWNVVVSHIHRMRPKGCPAFIGVDYWHVAYRLYVRCQPPGRPEPIEGLYFLRSDCDSPLMTLAGNALTDFRFHTSGIEVETRGESVQIQVASSEASARAALLPGQPPSLQPGSPFGSLEEAASFLKYRPFGISVDEGRGEANVVEITRKERAWRSPLVHVAEAGWQFFAGKQVALELCYEVEPIAYQWNRGKVYPLRQLSCR